VIKEHFNKKLHLLKIFFQKSHVLPISNKNSQKLNVLQSMNCQYCLKRKSHPLFCYLISNRYSTNSATAATYIGLSRQPFFRLKSHNREIDYRCGAKSTKAFAGKWELLLVIGPWYGNGGKLFKQIWRKSSRKLKSRLYMGITKAFEQNKRVYISTKSRLLKNL